MGDTLVHFEGTIISNNKQEQTLVIELDANTVFEESAVTFDYCKANIKGQTSLSIDERVELSSFMINPRLIFEIRGID